MQHEKVNLGDDLRPPHKSSRSDFLRLSGLRDFMSDPLLFMRQLAACGDDIVRLRLGPKHFVFVFSPGLAQEILLRRAPVYVQNRTIFERIQPVTGKKGLVQLSGAESRDARLKSRALFTTANIQAARTTIDSCTDDLIHQIGKASSLDVTEMMTHLILRTALRIFLGVDSLELVNSIGAKFLRLNYLCGLRMRALMPPPLALPTYKNREILTLRREIRALLEAHLARISGAPGLTVADVFSGDDARLDHCMTFLFAGHETTAASLTFTLLLLAQEPRYQDMIAGGDDAMTLAVYKESLRLFPPAYMLAREASGADELGGVRVRKSDQVILGLSVLHRHEDFFTHPNDFFPERFLAPLKHPFSFLPFGAGSKSCVGERLAYVEATAILSKICKNFQLSAESPQILAEPLITLHPSNHQHILFTPRAGGALGRHE